MKYFGDALSGLHKELNAAIRKPDQLERAKRLFLKYIPGCIYPR